MTRAPRPPEASLSHVVASTRKIDHLLLDRRLNDLLQAFSKSDYFDVGEILECKTFAVARRTQGNSGSVA